MKALVTRIIGKDVAARPIEVTAETLTTLAADAHWSPFRFKADGQCWDPSRGQTACPHPGQHRHGAHFESVQWVFYDFDDGDSYDEALAKVRRQNALAVLHTTKSHRVAKTSGGTTRPPCDRFRLGLALAEPITARGVYEHTWHVYRDSFGFRVDEQCKDVARFYYPHDPSLPGARSDWHLGEPLEPVTPEPDAEAVPVHRVVSLAEFPMEERMRRASAWLEKRDPAIEGKGGNSHTITTIRGSCWDFGIGDLETAMAVLEPWNARCSPPWEGREWRVKVASALRGCKRPLGWKLGEGKTHQGPSGEEVPALWTDEKTGAVIWPEKARLQLIVPLIAGRFEFLRMPDGSEATYSVSNTREATAQTSDIRIEEHVTKELLRLYEYPARGRLVTEGIGLWRRAGKSLETEPDLVAFGPSDNLVYRRLDFQPTEGPALAWDEFLSRLEHQEVFMAFVWSCFEPQHRGRQYLWLEGEGKDGKSTTVGVIADVFGGEKVAALAGLRKDFQHSACYGRPLAVYADIKDPKFSRCGFIRNITSGDHVSIEYKGKGAFSARLRCRLIIHGNISPDLGTDRAEQSRLIWLRVGESKQQNDPGWEARLRAELPAFLFRCRLAYEKLCPNHGDIALPVQLQEQVMAQGSVSEEAFELIWEEHFECAKDCGVLSGRMREILNVAGIRADDTLKVGDWKRWVRRTHDVNPEGSVRDPEKKRAYFGLRERGSNGCAKHPNGCPRQQSMTETRPSLPEPPLVLPLGEPPWKRCEKPGCGQPIAPGQVTRCLAHALDRAA